MIGSTPGLSGVQAATVGVGADAGLRRIVLGHPLHNYQAVHAFTDKLQQFHHLALSREQDYLAMALLLKQILSERRQQEFEQQAVTDEIDRLEDIHGKLEIEVKSKSQTLTSPCVLKSQ